MDELGLTQSTLYRKISALRSCGLLMVDRFLVSDDGKREALYVTTFTEMTLKAVNGRMELDLVETTRSRERRWLTAFFAEGITEPVAEPLDVYER